MKRLILLATLISFFLFGCATENGLFGFIATTDYVKKEIEAQKKQTDTEIKAVKSDVEEMKTLTNRVKNLLDEVEKTKQTTEELQKLADALKLRLNDLPRETLKQLVDILQMYLQESEKGKAAK